MKIEILAFGDKLPQWIEQGIHDYLKRLKNTLNVSLTPLPIAKGKATAKELIDKESKIIATHLKSSSYKIALTIDGQSFSSEQFALKLNNLSSTYKHVQFLIGGPNGLSGDIIKQCQTCWSLSRLTLTHSIARLFLVEALYRSYAINANHPYHK